MCQHGMGCKVAIRSLVGLMNQFQVEQWNGNQVAVDVEASEFQKKHLGKIFKKYS